MWNGWPERYGKFQSEIPSTSGAICEKPQRGPFGPPPRGARVKGKMIAQKEGIERVKRVPNGEKVWFTEKCRINLTKH